MKLQVYLKNNYLIINTIRVGILLVCCAFPASLRGQNQEMIDSLKRELEGAKGSKRFDLLIDLFREELNYNSQYSLDYANQAVTLALQMKDSLQIVKAYNAKGFVSRQRGELRTAIQCFSYAYPIANRNHYNDQVKYLLNNLAIAYTLNANYDQALYYNFESLKLREVEGKPIDVAVALGSIGWVFQRLKDYENALLFYQRSLDIRLKNGIRYELENTLINLGSVYHSLDRDDEAIEKFNDAINMCESGECRPGIITDAHQMLATCYLGLNELSKAELETHKSLDIALKMNLTQYIISSYRLLAEIRLRENRTVDAIALLTQSQEIAIKTGFRSDELENYLLLAKIYNKSNNFRLASEYQSKYISLNNEIYGSELIKNISKIRAAYEERENLKTIASKNQVLGLQQEIIQRQHDQYIFIFTITVLIMGLAFVLFWANFTQRKTNQALSTAKETIESQNLQLQQTNQRLEDLVTERTKELVNSNDALTKVNDELDNFIYKTSHDIRGPLASLKGICNVALMDVKDKTAVDYLSKLDMTAGKLNSILSRLLIINQINHSVLNPGAINFETILDEIIELEEKKGLPPRMVIDRHVDSNIAINSDRELIRIILENLIDNAIKFYNESERVQPFVRINIEQLHEQVRMRISDNGIGIDEGNREKIFQLFVRTSARSETGGIGLYLTKLATQKLGGTISYSATEENHTEFTIVLPCDLVAVIEQQRKEGRRQEIEKWRQKDL